MLDEGSDAKFIEVRCLGGEDGGSGRKHVDEATNDVVKWDRFEWAALLIVSRVAR